MFFLPESPLYLVPVVRMKRPFSLYSGSVVLEWMKQKTNWKQLEKLQMHKYQTKCLNKKKNLHSFKKCCIRVP